ncbi:MAG: ABC transporter permease [Myxococcota bacterium]
MSSAQRIEPAAEKVMAQKVSGAASHGWTVRSKVMLSTGLRMMFHDRLKFLGTIFGVVFAVLICVQQLGILNGLLSKNTMFVDNAGADLWIVPPDTELLQTGPVLPESILYRAKVTPGVAIASPLVFAGASVQTPAGGREPVTLAGTDAPEFLGGPWNIVAGERARLLSPETVFVEDSRRQALGGVNLGSVREINGNRVVVGGFTWGLQPFGPPYAFAEIELARRLLNLPNRAFHFVLIRVDDRASLARVQARLQAQMVNCEVLSREQFSDRIATTLLREQLGVSFGTSTSFGLLIGFVVVALAMFSSVLDNQRQFGTLKAIGCSNFDLTLLVLMQSVAYAAIGSLAGLGAVTRIAAVARSPELAVIVPWQLLAFTPVVMVLVCLIASVLALSRVWRLEPGMVFR